MLNKTAAHERKPVASLYSAPQGTRVSDSAWSHKSCAYYEIPRWLFYGKHIHYIYKTLLTNLQYRLQLIYGAMKSLRSVSVILLEKRVSSGLKLQSSCLIWQARVRPQTFLNSKGIVQVVQSNACAPTSRVKIPRKTLTNAYTAYSAISIYLRKKFSFKYSTFNVAVNFTLQLKGTSCQSDLSPSSLLKRKTDRSQELSFVNQFWNFHASYLLG